MDKIKWMVFLFVFLPSMAGATEIRCPETITVRQELTQAVEGWEVAYEDVAYQLATITFFDGHPKEQASLVYSEYTESEAHDENYAIWRFEADTVARGVWLSCSYARTNVVLSKRLPSQILACTVTYTRNVLIEGFPVVKKIECQ